jgi:uncharacterized protein
MSCKHITCIFVLGFAGMACTALTVLAADSPIADAAQQGDIDAVRSLLRQRAAVDASQSDGMTALHWAAQTDNVELTRMLLQGGASVRAATRNGGYTPLLIAARNGHGVVIEILLKAGADVAGSTTTGITALMLAALSGRADAVNMLLAHGAGVNATEHTHGQTALMLAAALNRTDVIKALLEHGADTALSTKVTKSGGDAPAPQSPVAAARKGQNFREGLRQLIDDITPNGPTILGGLTALHYAAREGRSEAVRTLLDRGANVNERSPGDQTTPLLIAVTNGQFDLAMYLLEREADPKIANTAGATPLFAALNIQWAPRPNYPKPSPAQQKVTYLELMKALLMRGANPNARVKEMLWWTNYNIAGQTGLTEAGATAFWRAAQSSDIDAMRLLVSAGADPKIANDQSVTPLSAAAGVGWNGNYNVNSPVGWMPAVKYLVEELGADVNARDVMNGTPLHGAAWRGDNEMIQYLVEKGADVTVVTVNGLTVADMANGPVQRLQPFPETVALLLKLGSPFNNYCASC